MSNSNMHNRAKNYKRVQSKSDNSRKSGQTTMKNKTANQNNHKDVTKNTYLLEVKVWVFSAVLLILELGNFGMAAFMNHISDFMFGIFGVIQYVLPLILILAMFFLHVNHYIKLAIHKVIFASFVVLCFGIIGQLVIGMEKYSFVGLFKEGFEDHIGGGILCGSFAFLLNALVGITGTYIIIVLGIIISVVFFAEISLIDLLKSIFVIMPVKNKGTEKKDLKIKKTSKYVSNSNQIVREDYSNVQEESIGRVKEKSILERMSVLPSKHGQGILASSNDDSLTKNEEIHEIIMDYEIDLPLQSKNTPQTMKNEEKIENKIAKEPVQKLNQDMENQSVDDDKDSAIDVSSINIENKTVSAVKNVSAKEVGNSDKTYQYPPLELLNRSKSQGSIKDDLIKQNAIKLQEVLKSFGVNVTMTNYSCGPSVTRYEMVPEQGVKVSKITGLADDIMMNLAAQSIRIEAPIPGKSAVGIEIPNSKRTGVGFRELIDTEKFIKYPSKISFAVGKDIEGNVVVEDIAKMPHLLIAGATGSGKSVCTNTLIMSILYKARPDEVKLILIDPKQVELKVYNGIPHLLTEVVTDPKKAASALNWAVAEMTKRYQLFSDYNVRNIQGFNAKVKELEKSGTAEDALEKMPQIVIIVDELADLMMVAKSEVEEAIVRLAQLARAAGIHLVIATQRPSVDVVTGLIKANVPSRIALSVSSGVDSRTIIDSVGAEKLLGNGDMLFYPTNYPKPVRVQGAYVSDDEVLNVVEFLKAKNTDHSYNEEIMNHMEQASNSTITLDHSMSEDRDEYFVQAGRFIIEKEKASIGMLQRMFKIGFNRAARIMDQLFEAGVVGPEEGTKPRQVLMSEEEFNQYIDEYF